MAAYLIVDIDITDGDLFKTYMEGVPEVLARFGGKYLARGGDFKVVEGDWNPRRITVIEFASSEKFQAFYDSSDYADLMALRKKASDSRWVVVEGVAAS
jgi:uncharacterized protein (DUF1330 family)